MQDSDTTTTVPRGTAPRERARGTATAPGGRVLVVTTRRPSPRLPDGPMNYMPYRPADENDPEAHIFRGED
ncbi:hypothetical protein [Streptomyces sp. NPDC048172]|uniref:hypothetical protein n=1 Tax=Streptomyces sp. NPDC048172 TaxID=3365505 RepID=UPI003721342E